MRRGRPKILPAARGRSPARRCAADLGRDRVEDPPWRGGRAQQNSRQYGQARPTKSPAQIRKQRPCDFCHGLLAAASALLLLGITAIGRAAQPDSTTAGDKAAMADELASLPLIEITDLHQLTQLSFDGRDLLAVTPQARPMG